ncbi:GNAT family N-acetyltransferase [Streptomyces sp. NPDC053048]|uniref:GNAT family N-acetyltransferase n=1 Tax=Streptomyces sp. NPDC053048 TaxID=3365694 RepID=UPI0037D968DA
MIPELVDTWVAGWAVSRGTPAPSERPWGHYIEVGLPEHRGRHVLTDTSGSAIRRAAASVTVPNTWLKAPMDPEEVEPWLPAGWVVDRVETGHLMATDLQATDPVLPAGFTTTVETRDGVTYVQVYDAAGERAAKGQMAVLGEATVVDRVETAEAHRRRGLGGFVMRTLADRASAEGATLGVLGATDEGRALYESLGWKAHAALAACVYRP